MENISSLYVKKITIKGLWSLYDFTWKLHRNVNILVGANGSGKTTILRLLHQALQGDFFVKEEKFFPLQEISITTTINEEERVTKIVAHQTVPTQEKPKLPIYYINTFDAKKSNLSTYETVHKPQLQTELDVVLDDLIDDYVEYQLTITKQLQKLFLNQPLVKIKDEQEKIFSKLRLFHNFLNQLFRYTHKSVNEENNRLSFRLKTQKISPYQLSAGEKQLLIILLTALIQDNQPSILIMDEPELSLHVGWQDELINMIRQLNEHCQLIIVTHSPSIFGKGWHDKVFWMDDLLSPIKSDDDAGTSSQLL